MTHELRTITDNLDELLNVLPTDLREAISPADRVELLEIVLDLGRKPEARFAHRFAYLREAPITREELQEIETKLGAFGTDNRAGIPATLHRISAMRNRRGEVVGLTMRVGRAVMGIVDILRDLIESGQSLLLMGRPGLGKTTLLREMARVLADEVGKRVVIVDTSNEIAGDGDVPHPAIGRARRMQVAQVSQQHDVMIEAVENHMPEVVVIDEIGRIEETLAARTIAERGVQLVATVHGNTLDNLVANPTMSDLVGGIQAVTLSDEEARRRGTQKTVLERKAPPTFDVVVEMIERDQIAVRRPVAEVVDALLRGHAAPPELRWRDENGEVQFEIPPPVAAPDNASTRGDFEAGYHAQQRSGGRQNARGGGRGNARQPRTDDDYNPSRRRNGRDTNDFSDARPASRAKLEIPKSTPEFRVPTGGGAVGRADTFEEASPVARRYRDFAAGKFGKANSVAEETDADEIAPLPRATNENSEEEIEDTSDESEDENGEISDEERLIKPRSMPAPVDLGRVRSLYPFGVSRSRLSRALKHLGLPLAVARTWQEAGAILMLAGPQGLPENSSLLQEPRDLGLPIIHVEGNTYAQIVARLNELASSAGGDGKLSPKDLALREAQTAVQRVLADAEPVELRAQTRQMRRLQHGIAARFHLRSYSVGREPNRRVRFLPSLAR